MPTVKYGTQFGLAFHPELDEDLTVHQHFIRMVEQFRLKNAG